MFIFLTNLNPFGLVHTKLLTELLMLHMNFLLKMVLHLTYIGIIYYLIIQKKPLLYPHLRNFMRFSYSITHNTPKPIQYANSDSSPFNYDESLSDDPSFSDDNQTLSPNDLSTQTSSNTNPSSNTNLPSQPILQYPSTNHSFDRTRHPSQNLSPSSITKNRDTKTHYDLRQQPKMDYRIFIPPSKL